MVKKMRSWLSYLRRLALLALLPALFVHTAVCEASPQAAKIVQIAVADIPFFFSPYVRSPLPLGYAHLFFDPLLRWGDKRQLEKRLLSKWKTIKPSVTRFYLKKNIRFHSGHHLGSDDIVWTFAQILKEPQSRRFFIGIKSIKRVDQYSFDIVSALSQAQLLDYLTHFFVMDKRFYTRNKIDSNKSQAIVSTRDNQLSLSGTGPYKIKQYNPALHLHVESNLDYWQGQPAISELIFLKIKSPNSRLYALLANDVDMSESIPHQAIDSVRLAPSKSIVEVISSNVVFLTINDKKSAVFKRAVAREAALLSINRVGMLKHIGKGLGSVSATFTPLQQGATSLPKQTLPDYDVARSKYIFTKIALPEQLTLLVLLDKVGNTTQIASALANMMKRVGIKLVITEVSSLQKWNTLLFDYDFSLSAWQSPLLESDNIYQDLFVSSASANFISDLFAREKNLDTRQKQARLFQQIQQEHRLAPLLFLNKIWATDKSYNLATIFSVNGIPYWHLLAVTE